MLTNETLDPVNVFCVLRASLENYGRVSNMVSTRDYRLAYGRSLPRHGG